MGDGQRFELGGYVGVFDPFRLVVDAFEVEGETGFERRVLVDRMC